MMYSILLVSMGLATRAAAACSRELLQEVTAAYIEAQTAGAPNFSLLASNVSYLENDTPTDITKGVLSQPITIDFDRSLLDTTQCGTFTELSAATSEHPYVIHTRMLLTDEKVTTIQSVVTDAGDWLFNATAHLYWTQKEKWDPIAEADRDSREVIQAAGDAYLDSWTDSSVTVPYGTPCARLEGGAYTGEQSPTTNTCTMPLFPEDFTIGNRRYIIDEEVGGLDIFNDFPFIDLTAPDGTPSSNFIRVEGGTIHNIHELTVCGAPMCGR